MPKNRSYGCDETFPGSDFDAEEFELLKAVEHYKRKTKKKFVGCCEVLEIVKSLGYRQMVSGKEPEKAEG